MYETEETIREKYKIKKQHIIEALEGIRTTVTWLETSIYQNIIEDVTFYISDAPINYPGQLEIDDEGDFKPIIYMNIMAIAEDYKNKEYLLDMKRLCVSCYEYAAFICLHEVGHLCHGLLGGKGRDKRDRLFDYFNRGEFYYERFIEEMKYGHTHEEKKRYRNIPHEKAADQFAFHNLNIMLAKLNKSMEKNE
ncbi:hypothetical protein [Alkalihalobacterium sp. APHAB7]|uniref:hypothetical protein n=1 Tax=Alkalihalobacterium sp. APHAB7 TaxID=3402081 RepID=UPI003AAFEF2A